MEFRRLWLGQSVSLLGSQVTQLAIPLIAIVQLHASVGSLGILALLRFLPFPLLALPAGSVVDHWPRRPVLVVTNLGRAALVAALPLMAATGTLGMADLYLMSLASGVLSVVFVIAFRSAIPDLVGPDDLVAAQSRLAGSETVALVAGPGVGGLLIAAVTAPWALLADAASFVVAAVAAAGMAEPAPRPRSGPGPGESLDGGPFVGLRTLACHPMLRAVAAEGAIANLCGTMMATLFVVFAVRELSLGSVAIGVVLAAGGAGALAGAGSAGRLGTRIAPGRLCLVALAVADLSLLALPIVGGHGAVVVVALASLFAVQGAATAVFEIHTSVLTYASTPADLHGRTQAAMRFVGSFGLISGAILGGTLGQLIGLRLALGAAAVAGMCHWPVLLHSPFAQASRKDVAGVRPAATLETR